MVSLAALFACLVIVMGVLYELFSVIQKERIKSELELYALAGEITEQLQYAAREKAVTLNLSGNEAIVSGIRKLLFEILYNLCDNAIKYNREGGRVDICVSHDEKRASITVKDTGIGIPPEHRERIFERFYRVDKSHSKQSGGTGLGLSIVKHAVAYHNGTVRLASVPGEGSEFTVTIPMKDEEK